MEALVGCALAKYGAVAGMHAAQMVEGLLHNLLGLADEHAVVVAAAAANAPRRYDFASAEPLKKGESAAERAFWMKLWPRIELAELPGFPSWDKQVHDALRPHCADLVSVFCNYCKQGGADGAAAVRKRTPFNCQGALSSAILEILRLLHQLIYPGSIR